LINQKEFKNVLGDVKLCDKAITLDNARKSIILFIVSKAVNNKLQINFIFIAKKVAETSAKKEKKEKVVKQEKAVNKEAVPDLGGDEEEISLEPKTKDPFEAFPKGYNNCLLSYAMFYLNFNQYLVLGLWMTLKGFIQIIRRTNRFLIFGKSLIKKIIRFGIANTNMQMN
jgi:hypothetical protein